MILTATEKRTLNELGAQRNQLFEKKHDLDNKIDKMLIDLANLVKQREKLTSEMLKVDYETNQILGI